MLSGLPLPGSICHKKTHLRVRLFCAEASPLPRTILQENDMHPCEVRQRKPQIFCRRLLIT